jgi:hypothetical protein
MIGFDGELPVKPERTNVRRVLIAHAMRYESGVRNGHKIFRGSAAGPLEGEGVFTNLSLGFKPNVL